MLLLWNQHLFSDRVKSSFRQTRCLFFLARTKGKVIAGGKSECLKIEPTVLQVVGVVPDVAVMEGEIFGLIFPILRSSSETRAILYPTGELLTPANTFCHSFLKRDHSLGLYAFTESDGVKSFSTYYVNSGCLTWALCRTSRSLFG